MVSDHLYFASGFLQSENSSHSPSLDDSLQLTLSIMPEIGSHWQIELPGNVASKNFLNFDSTVVDIVIEQS
jgi:hypothetical protein